MTDWERVQRLRQKGRSWSEIAADPRVDFHPEGGTDPGRSLKFLYNRRRSDRGGKPGKAGSGTPPGSAGGTGLAGHKKGIAALLGVAVVVAIAVYLILFVVAPAATPSIVTYCGGEGTAAHWHVLLVIEDDGVQEHLPYDASQSADIGYIDSPGYTNSAYYCAGGGIHAIHTHDGSGILHLELPASIPYSPAPTLSEFFTIWGEPLSPSSVWVYSGHVSAHAIFNDQGPSQDFSSDPGSIPLSVPAGGPLSNPYAIPPNWDFSGAYGNGASGGTFGGEIIWLNVTSG